MKDNFLKQIDADPQLTRKLLLIIIAAAFAVRLININAPIADRHSWNQTSAASTIRNFVDSGIDPLHPQWDVLKKNSAAKRIEMEEAPIYHVAAAALTKVFGNLEVCARLLNVLSSIVGGLFLFMLCRRLYGAATALFSTFFLLFSAIGIFYSRTIMSDGWMLAAIIVSFERYELWLHDDKPKALYQSAAAVMFAGLFKPFALHIGAAFIIMQIKRKGARSLFDPKLVLFAVISLAPPLAWITYAALNSSLGGAVDPGETALSTTKLFGPVSMLLTLQFWSNIQARLFDRMATPIVAMLSLCAIVVPTVRSRAFPALAWLLSAFFYLLIMRSGNNVHDYYQLPFIPPFAILAGLGLREISRRFDNRLVYLLLAAFFIWSGIYALNGFRLESASQIAGRMVREVSAPDDLILVLNPGVTRKNQIIYAAHRKGWHIHSIEEDTLDHYRELGAKWLVSCVPIKVIERNPEWEERLHSLEKLAGDEGPYGYLEQINRIAVYRLAPEVEKFPEASTAPSAATATTR